MAFVKDRLPVRTSDSHPITVSWVLGGKANATECRGRLGLCYCPGKEVRLRLAVIKSHKIQPVYFMTRSDCLIAYQLVCRDFKVVYDMVSSWINWRLRLQQRHFYHIRFSADLQRMMFIHVCLGY